MLAAVSVALTLRIAVNEDALHRMRSSGRSLEAWTGIPRDLVGWLFGMGRLEVRGLVPSPVGAAGLVSREARLTGRPKMAERFSVREDWHDNGLLFCHPDGCQYVHDLNWRSGKMTRRVGPSHWHPRGRHTAVSITSHNGVRIQDISDHEGHKSTRFTETRLRPVSSGGHSRSIDPGL
jgi:hypothetical protein